MKSCVFEGVESIFEVWLVTKAHIRELSKILPYYNAENKARIGENILPELIGIILVEIL